METGSRPTLLIVEDEPLIAARLRYMLEEMGYEPPPVASSGEEALDQAASLHPDLVLMDIRLSGRMDGIEAAEQLRIRFDVPVIYLTGWVDDKVLERACVTEPLGYLVKPFEKTDLHAAVILADHKRRLEVRQHEGTARFRINPAGQLLFASLPLAKILGYPDGESLIHLNFFDLCVEPQGHRGDQSPLTREKVARDIEMQLLRRDGTTIWVSAASRAVCSADGETSYFEGSLVDISAWKRAEGQLRRRAAHLEALNAIVTTTAAAADLADLLNSALDPVLQAFGLVEGSIWLNGQHAVRGFSGDKQMINTLHQAAGAAFPLIMRIDDWQMAQVDAPLSELAPRLLQSGIRSSLIGPIMSGSRAIGGINLATSEVRTWTSNEVAFLETLGHQLGAAVERLRLMETIREQVLQVHQIIHAVPEGVLLLGTGSHILMANPVGREYLSVLSDAHIGDVLSQLGGHPLPELMTSPPPGLWHQIEVENRGFEVIARSIEPELETAGWVLVIRDVTQRQALERRMQRQDRLAAVGQLAAGIAHDLNNMFTVINIHAQLATGYEGIPAEVQRRIETVLRQGERGSHLIEQVLDFSRQTAMDRRPLALTPLVKEAVKLLQHMLPESIVLTLSQGTDDYIVNADPTRIQQVLMNLAINARDSMPDGGTLEISLARSRYRKGAARPLPEMKPGEWVRLSVKDCGTGIPADILPQIFDPFFTTKAPGKGTGLGLAQVHGIVEQHEGHIDVVSVEGQGSTFTVYLPAIPLPDPCPPAKSAPIVARGAGEWVLVVEDDPATREVLVDGLKSLNYRVKEAVNGHQALDLIGRNGDETALILTDLVMPEMGGKALLNALAEQGWSGPLIILSGHSLGDKKEEGIDDQRVTAVLTKPVRLEQLAQAVDQALRLGLNPNGMDSPTPDPGTR